MVDVFLNSKKEFDTMIECYVIIHSKQYIKKFPKNDKLHDYIYKSLEK